MVTGNESLNRKFLSTDLGGRDSNQTDWVKKVLPDDVKKLLGPSKARPAKQGHKIAETNKRPMKIDQNV